MSNGAIEIEPAGDPQKAGTPREGKAISLIVLTDIASASAVGDADLPNYQIDQLGTIRQFVSDQRAATVLDLAIYNKRRTNINRISLSIQLEKPAETDYSEAQLRALYSLLAELQARHKLSETDLAAIAPDEEQRLRVYPALPPAPPIGLFDTLLVLGAAPLEPPQRLRMWLYGETWRQRSGNPALNTAFAFYAAKFGLGAPIAPNAPPAVSFANRAYNIQVFARDTIYNEGSDWSGIQSTNAQLEATQGPEGLALALVTASYEASIKATEARLGSPVQGNKPFRPDWRFHVVAANSRLGPAISGNYAFQADQRYAFQVFALDTLYTPSSEPSGCYQLSLTEPSHPAYAALWAETYKYAKASYDAQSPFQQRAAHEKLGTPLSGVYTAEFEGTSYSIQVFAADTLYSGPDGQIKRMSELPLDQKILDWNPTAPKVLPPAAPPATLAPSTPTSIPAVNAVPNDPSWPPMPKFQILTDVNNGREKAFGHIEWRRRGGAREVDILNNWEAEHIVTVDVPQLSKFRLAGNGKVRFHKIAAGQLQRFWAEVEKAGLLHLVLTFDGGFYPRIMTSNPNRLSNHAYGTAFDINAQWNGWQQRPALVGQKGSIRELVPIANALGFFWGGHWPNYLDGMHFEWAVAR